MWGKYFRGVACDLPSERKRDREGGGRDEARMDCC